MSVMKQSIGDCLLRRLEKTGSRHIFGVPGDYNLELMQAVLGKDAKYNDIANWRYSELPNVFSRDKKAETYVVLTSNEFQKVLDSPHSGMVFVECIMDKYDAPLRFDPRWSRDQPTPTTGHAGHRQQ